LRGAPSLDDLRDAAARIAPYARRTPVFTSRTLDEMTGAACFFKCENFQRAGAFKFRGACNAVFSLSGAEAAHGVVTHSSGNHAQALALAAGLRGIPAHIVMPRTVLAVKQAAVAGYGGRITLCEPTLAAREDATVRIQRDTGAELVHPYNDYRVIAGQGTAALELCEEVPALDAVIAPVGGGGLLSGTAIAITALCPGAAIYGAEPAAADDALRSLRAGRILPAGNPKTVADGLLTSLGDKTFPIIKKLVRDIVAVSEDEIVSAMRLVWERMKLVIEPSAAVAVAALLRHREGLSGARVGVILSGGNVDLDRLPWGGTAR
jgi:threonine dehydratase